MSERYYRNCDHYVKDDDLVCQVCLQAERDALTAEIKEMAALLDITLNAGVEPSRLELVEMKAERDALKAALEKIDQMESVEDSGCNSVWDYLAEIKYIVHSALEAQKGGDK